VHDRVGRRTEAIAAYNLALNANPRDDRLQLREKIHAAMRRAPASRACR